MADTPAGRPAAANVPLVIVNPARDFTLSIRGERAVLACPLCTTAYLAGDGTYRQWERLTVDDSDSLGQLVDLALGHIAEAHPEHLVPAPVVLGPASDFVLSRVINVGDTVKWGHLVRVPADQLPPRPTS